MTTLTAEQRRGRLLARVFVWVMAIVTVGTFAFGWYVVNGQRQLAAETDRRLRTLAWATLAYADAHHRFPADDEAIVAFGAGPATLPAVGKCPTRRDDALRGESPADLRQALTSIIAVWDGDPLKSPKFLANRLPTRHGTLEDVARWMTETQKALEGPAATADR